MNDHLLGKSCAERYIIREGVTIHRATGTAKRTVVGPLMNVIVGVSRVYLRVHYPTDVLAGWLAELTWSLPCWLIARWLQRNRHVEPPGEEPSLSNHIHSGSIDG